MIYREEEFDAVGVVIKVKSVDDEDEMERTTLSKSRCAAMVFE